MAFVVHDKGNLELRDQNCEENRNRETKREITGYGEIKIPGGFRGSLTAVDDHRPVRCACRLQCSPVMKLPMWRLERRETFGQRLVVQTREAEIVSAIVSYLAQGVQVVVQIGTDPSGA